MAILRNTQGGTTKAQMLKSNAQPGTKLCPDLFKGGEIRDLKNRILSRSIVSLFVFGRCFPLLSEKDFFGATSAMFVYL